jgi:hypothetical protein
MPTWTLPLLFILCACRSPAVDSGPGQDSDGPPHDTGAGEPVFSGDYPVEQASVRLYASEPQQHAGRVLASGDVDGDGAEELLVTTVRDDDYEGGAWLLSALPEGQGSLEEHGLRLEGSGSTLGAGRAASLGDTDGDGLADLLISAPYPGSDALLLLAAPFEQDLELAEAGTRLAGEDGGTTGHDAQLVDLDGDGLCDVVAGAPGGFGSSDAGAVFLVHAPIAEGTTSLALEARATLAGAEPGDGAGRTVRAGGDVDGDGLADLLAGAPYADREGADRGVVHLVLGPLQGSSSLSDAQAELRGENPGDLAGLDLALFDVDGDGLADPIIGAQGPAAQLQGAVYVLTSLPEGVVHLEVALSFLSPVRGDEADGAVLVLVVVPVHEVLDPGLGCLDAVEGLGGVLRAVLDGPEQGLRVGIVVADTGSAVGGPDREVVEHSKQRRGGHGRAAVRVEHEALGAALSQRGLHHQARGVGAELGGLNGPADDLAAPDVEGHVQVEELPAHGAS